MRNLPRFGELNSFNIKQIQKNIIKLIKTSVIKVMLIKRINNTNSYLLTQLRIQKS